MYCNFKEKRQPISYQASPYTQRSNQLGYGFTSQSGNKDNGIGGTFVDAVAPNVGVLSTDELKSQNPNFEMLPNSLRFFWIIFFVFND